jgi:N-acetylmuramoyl-L-alanine amidase
MKCKRNAKRVVALALALLAVAPFMAISPKAINVYGVKEVYDARTSKYEYVKVRVGSGNIEVPSRLIHSTTYVSLKYFCEALCYCKTTYSSATRTATVTADNLKITAQDGSHYICANGRYLWTDTAVKILDDGRIYVPIRTLAKAFGVSVDWDNATRSVTVKGPLNIIKSGDAYYNADAVYWLSRIISAESRGEPLLGQIAVGNVVLNRVRSPNYPNTIYGVIFDRKYGVQFSPVLDGRIYNTPSYQSRLAAMICLEGTRVSDSALFFLAPRYATSSWIPNSREYLFSIMHHDFYA